MKVQISSAVAGLPRISTLAARSVPVLPAASSRTRTDQVPPLSMPRSAATPKVQSPSMVAVPPSRA